MEDNRAIVGRNRERFYVIVGSGFYLGLIPGARGSYAALLGVAGHLALATLLPRPFDVAAVAVLLLLVSWANHVLTPWAQRYWNSSDPSRFILDEIAGYLVVPIVYWGDNLVATAVWGFVLFRLLDIIKIPPAWQIDRRRHDSWGILLDDIVSGVYAGLVLYLMEWLQATTGMNAGL
ncbi:MAG: phosphatidylglycerophosphatase A [Desulfatibacillaceae bacterium]